MFFFKGNVEHKLRELGIPLNISKEIISDIMGRTSYLQYGLVDAKNSEELEMMLEGVKVRWNELEKPNNSLPKFYNWFVKHCLSVITECMIQDVLKNAGLGSPPEPYYTNEVESKNKVIKEEVRYKKSDLPEFVHKMSNLMHEQKQEIESSVINSGEYRVREEYQQYAVDSTHWFQMTSDKKTRKINAFMKSQIYRPANTLVSTSKCPLEILGLPK